MVISSALLLSRERINNFVRIMQIRIYNCLKFKLKKNNLICGIVIRINGSSSGSSLGKFFRVRNDGYSNLEMD